MDNQDVIIAHRALRDALIECVELRVKSEVLSEDWEYDGKTIELKTVKATIQLIWLPTGEVITEAVL